MKDWADSVQAFLVRVMSSFFITFFSLHFELSLFATTHDTQDILCVRYWPGLIAASCALWFCFHLLIYRKDQP